MLQLFRISFPQATLLLSFCHALFLSIFGTRWMIDQCTLCTFFLHILSSSGVSHWPEVSSSDSLSSCTFYLHLVCHIDPRCPHLIHFLLAHSIFIWCVTLTRGVLIWFTFFLHILSLSGMSHWPRCPHLIHFLLAHSIFIWRVTLTQGVLIWFTFFLHILSLSDLSHWPEVSSSDSLSSCTFYLYLICHIDPRYPHLIHFLLAHAIFIWRVTLTEVSSSDSLSSCTFYLHLVCHIDPRCPHLIHFLLAFYLYLACHIDPRCPHLIHFLLAHSIFIWSVTLTEVSSSDSLSSCTFHLYLVCHIDPRCPHLIHFLLAHSIFIWSVTLTWGVLIWFTFFLHILSLSGLSHWPRCPHLIHFLLAHSVFIWYVTLTRGVLVWFTFFLHILSLSGVSHWLRCPHLIHFLLAHSFFLHIPSLSGMSHWPEVSSSDSLSSCTFYPYLVCHIDPRCPHLIHFLLAHSVFIWRVTLTRGVLIWFS